MREKTQRLDLFLCPPLACRPRFAGSFQFRVQSFELQEYCGHCERSEAIFIVNPEKHKNAVALRFPPCRNPEAEQRSSAMSREKPVPSAFACLILVLKRRNNNVICGQTLKLSKDEVDTLGSVPYITFHKKMNINDEEACNGEKTGYLQM